MKWIYREKEVTPDTVPEWAVGIVYVIYKMQSEYHKNMRLTKSACSGNYEKLYIGKKLLNSTTKKKIGVRAQAKQLLETNDKRRVKKVTRVVKDSGWMNYNSSCKPLQEDIKEHPELFIKEILHWCHSKKHMTYCEMREQFLHLVLETDSYNDNIAGTLYRRDLIKPEDKPKNINGVVAYIDGKNYEVGIDPITDKMTIKK